MIHLTFERTGSFRFSELVRLSKLVHSDSSIQRTASKQWRWNKVSLSESYLLQHCEWHKYRVNDNERTGTERKIKTMIRPSRICDLHMKTASASGGSALYLSSWMWQPATLLSDAPESTNRVPALRCHSSTCEGLETPSNAPRLHREKVNAFWKTFLKDDTVSLKMRKAHNSATFRPFRT